MYVSIFYVFSLCRTWNYRLGTIYAMAGTLQETYFLWLVRIWPINQCIWVMRARSEFWFCSTHHFPRNGSSHPCLGEGSTSWHISPIAPLFHGFPWSWNLAIGSSCFGVLSLLPLLLLPVATAEHWLHINIYDDKPCSLWPPVLFHVPLAGNAAARRHVWRIDNSQVSHKARSFPFS